MRFIRLVADGRWPNTKMLELDAFASILKCWSLHTRGNGAKECSKLKGIWEEKVEVVYLEV